MGEESIDEQINLTAAEKQTLVGARIARPSTYQDDYISAYEQKSVGAKTQSVEMEAPFVPLCGNNRPYDPKLTEIGIIVDNAIQKISDIYPSVLVEEYVIMPNHIHIILRIRADKFRRPMAAPTISRGVNQLKGYASKQVGHPIWQKLFYDHVIRNKKDYDRLEKYIYENPLNWFYDELNPENISSN